MFGRKSIEDILPLLSTFWTEAVPAKDRVFPYKLARFCGIDGYLDYPRSFLGHNPADSTLIKWADRDVVKEGGKFRVPVKSGYEHHFLVSDKLVLVAGVGFTSGDSYLEFDRHPSILFPNRKILSFYRTRGPSDPRDSWYNTPNCGREVTFVLEAARGVCSSSTLQAAVAAAGGVPVVCDDTAVVAVDQGVVYLANGQHFPDTDEGLQVGQELKKGFVAGNVRVISSSRKPYWWRKAGSWTEGGLLLNQLMAAGDPFSGPLVAPDRMVNAWVEGGSHVRFELDGTEADKNIFFDNLHAKETAAGKYLNTGLGLDPSGKKSLINPVDVLFRFVFGFKSTILVLDPEKTPRFLEALHFFRENLPLGHTPFLSLGASLGPATLEGTRFYLFDPSTGEWQTTTVADFS